MRLLKLFMSVLVIGMLGCGGSANPPVPASGKVVLNKNPVEGAVVTFLSKNGGRSASGKTAKDGTFKLTTINTDDGAPPGDYVVTILKQESKVSSDNIDVSGGQFGDAYAQMMTAAGNNTIKKLMKDVLPAKYGDPAQSGLTRTIVKGEANDFTFDLQ